jgi:hypothetical protein
VIATVLVNAFSLALFMGMLSKRLPQMHLHRLFPPVLCICVAGGASASLAYTGRHPFHELSKQPRHLARSNLQQSRGGCRCRGAVYAKAGPHLLSWICSATMPLELPLLVLKLVQWATEASVLGVAAGLGLVTFVGLIFALRMNFQGLVQ